MGLLLILLLPIAAALGVLWRRSRRESGLGLPPTSALSDMRTRSELSAHGMDADPYRH